MIRAELIELIAVKWLAGTLTSCQMLRAYVAAWLPWVDVDYPDGNLLLMERGVRDKAAERQHGGLRMRWREYYLSGWRIQVTQNQNY